MAKITTSPDERLLLRLEQRKSFALGLLFRDGAGRPINMVGSDITLTWLNNPARLNHPEQVQPEDISTVTADMGDAAIGYVRFRVQASDLDLPVGNLPYSITLRTAGGYSVVLAKGEYEILPNPETAAAGFEFSDTPTRTVLDVALQDNKVVNLTVGGVVPPGRDWLTEEERAKLATIVVTDDGIVVDLSDYALASHDHDDRYSLADHLHDARYALLTHDHDDIYATIGHDHDDRYSLLTHDHDSVYATVGHDHVMADITDYQDPLNRPGGVITTISNSLRVTNPDRPSGAVISTITSDGLPAIWFGRTNTTSVTEPRVYASSSYLELHPGTAQPRVRLQGETHVTDVLYTQEVRQNNPSRGNGHIILLTTSGGDPAVWFSDTAGTPGGRPRIVGSANQLDIFAAGASTTTGRIVFQNPVRYSGRPESTFTANMGLANSPADVVYKLTSSRRSKLMIEPVSTPAERILDIEPRDWIDRNEAEEYAAYMAGDRERSDINDQPFRRIPGVVAEELEDAGLEQFVTYEKDPDNPGQMRTAGVMYDRLWTLLIPVVRDLREQVAELQQQVDEFKAGGASS